MLNFLIIVIYSIVTVLLVILMAAVLTLFERQVLAAIQRRKGPNVVGFWGLLQPFADAFKLLFKEQAIPDSSARVLFLGSAVFVVWISTVVWVVIPTSYGAFLIDSNIILLFFLSISSLSIYGVIVSGWASNSRYAFLGALRACAQLLSYELSMTTLILILVLTTGTLNISEMVIWIHESSWLNTIWLIPVGVLWVIIALAETYRAPFDLAEAESELVSGFNVEYSSMNFAFLFLGEYIHIVVMANITTLIFLGAWYPPAILDFLFDLSKSIIPENFLNFLTLSVFNFFNGAFWYSLKVVIVLFVIIWIRATFPRLRYDQLMTFGWKILLPFTFSLFIIWVFFIGLTYSLVVTSFFVQSYIFLLWWFISKIFLVFSSILYMLFFSSIFLEIASYICL